jgi:hypothetical protein
MAGDNLFVAVSAFEPDAAERTYYLGTASNVSWVDDIDGPGSFSFALPVEDAGDLAIGWHIQFSLGTQSDDYVFGGFVEKLELQEVGAANAGTNRVYVITGRGWNSLLDQAIIYEAAGSPGSVRSVTAQNAGEVFDTLVSEAITRGAIDTLGLDFTTTLDSNGDAYAEDLTLDLRVGDSLGDVAGQVRELAADVWVTATGPWGWDLHLANERGTDRTTGTNPMVLRAGYHLGEFVEVSEAPIKNAILVGYGPNGATFTTKTDATSIATYGRQEGFLSLTNTEDTTQVDLAADQLLAQMKDPARSVTVAMNSLDLVPYLDFELGDRVLIADTTGDQVAYRLRAITVTVGTTGQPVFVPEFGTVRADLDRRLARALARIERGDLTSESVVATNPSDYSYTGGSSGAGTSLGKMAGGYLYGTEHYNNTFTNSFSHGIGYAVPMTVWQTSVIDAIILHVRDGSSGDANAYRARIGIYSETNGEPKDKVCETAEFNYGNGTYASPSLATLTLSPNITLTAGRYWIVFRRYNTTNAANPANPRWRGTVGTRGPMKDTLVLSGAPGVDSPASSSWELTGTGFGANSTTLPATMGFANLANLSSWMPEIWLRGV